MTRGGQGGGDKPATGGARPFAGLAVLRGQVRRAPRAEGGRQPDREAAGTPPQSFAQAVAGVAPLTPPNRADIDGPKPDPVPRFKSMREAEAAAEAGAARPLPAQDSFAEAMSGVAPLAPSNRVDPDLLVRQRGMARHTGPAVDAPDTLAAWLDKAPEPDDPAALFRHAVGHASPVADGGRVHVQGPLPAPQPLQREADEREALRESIGAPLSFEDRLEMGDEAAFLRPGLPRRALTDLRRGRWVIQSELDLHGLTRDEARGALGRFLAERLSRGERCVRIIHGKGRGSPGRVGILKQLSRSWLAQREEILAFCQARPHDGGEGALLVLLRTPRPGE